MQNLLPNKGLTQRLAATTVIREKVAWLVENARETHSFKDSAKRLLMLLLDPFVVTA
jgi:hypothetical protein